MKFRITMAAVAVASAAALFSGEAAAWDAATTNAGLTQRAVLASHLHQVLSGPLGRADGVFAAIKLHPERLDEGHRRALLWDLAALDAEGGYRPDANGANSAMGWITAGAVLAKMSGRARHSFFDPATGLGLQQDRNLAGLVFALREVPDSTGTVRELATGASFDLTGRPAIEWVRAAENELGLVAFCDQLEAAVVSPEQPAREQALARALMALGGMVAVLQDMGDPAHVRNDFRTAYMNAGGTNLWDRSSAFEQFVAQRYGRAGIPAAAEPVARPSLLAYFTAADGAGLADRTQRLFFSDGTLPADQILASNTDPTDVLRRVRASLLYPSPTVTRLELAPRARVRHLSISGRRALGYQVLGGRLRFLLDRAVYEDTAKAQLPLAAAYSAGLIDHIFGTPVRLTMEGQTLKVMAGERALPPHARLRVAIEDGQGVRRELTSREVAEPVSAGSLVASVEVPAGIRRVAVVLRGQRDGEPVVAVAELAAQPPARKPASDAAPKSPAPLPEPAPLP